MTDSGGQLATMSQQLRVLTARSEWTTTRCYYHHEQEHQLNLLLGRVSADSFGSKGLHIFPSYGYWTMWNLRFFGDVSNRIDPYKNRSPRFVLVTDSCRVNRSCTAKIISRMLQLAVDAQLTTDRVVTQTNSQTLFHSTYPLLLVELYGRPSGRPDDITFNALGNRLPVTW